MNWIGTRLVVLLAALATLGAQAGTVTYYHNDLAGSPVAATNASRQVIWRESYRPYGERTVNSAAALDEKVWFTSRRQDPDTGLVYMGARYYDPVTGRFVSMDPQGFNEKSVHSFNRYAYANNNPYKFVDPNGRTPLAIIAVEVAKWTGLGYGFGLAADAIGQYAAWGTVDLGMAATSNAAIAGGEAGLLSGLGMGGAAASAREVGETYKIVDGVRRAKAAELSGKSTIAAEIEGSNGKTTELAIDALRSPKDVIETGGAGARRWESVLAGTKQGSDMPPILVKQGSSGIPIKDVKVE